MKRLVAVIGPTAVGKSHLSLHLAQSLNGEIVNADSRQIYRYMDIGTAKPNHAARKVIKYHLLDIIDPDEAFSLAIYQKMAVAAIGDIQQQGKIPFIVGGSGLYIWSIIEGWQIPQVQPDIDFRQSLEARAKIEGSRVLYQELQQIDPVAAYKILPNNVRRIIRVLEINRVTGKLASELWQKQAPSFPILIIGLTTQRKDLYHRIDSRVDAMIAQGLVDEVKGLLTKGYGLNLPSMSSIGYRQIGMTLEGKLDMAEAIQQMKYETHRFARHQYAWFRLKDDRIHWFDVQENINKDTKTLVESFLAGLRDEK